MFGRDQRVGCPNVVGEAYLCEFQLGLRDTDARRGRVQFLPSGVEFLGCCYALGVALPGALPVAFSQLLGGLGFIENGPGAPDLLGALSLDRRKSRLGLL